MALQTGSTPSQLVNDWSGTFAQLNCNTSLAEVAGVDNLPTLSDIAKVFGNSTAVEIITRHLQSVIKYAGIELPDTQLAETALSMFFSYWYLNLAELCVFFSQLKNGSRGQFVWGSKINNQVIMVALSDFCNDRRREIEKKEVDKIRNHVEKSFSRSEDFAKGIVIGVQNFKSKREKAKQDYNTFCELFPYLPSNYDPIILWKAWGGDKNAIKQIYGDKIPSEEVVEKDIGSFLCDYNVAKSKENEGI